MKFRRKILISLCLILCTSLLKLSAETPLKGKEICDFVYKFLKDNKLNPSTQSLVSNSKNELPYNIILSNESDGENVNKPKLLFIFQAEEVYNDLELIKNLYEDLQSSSGKGEILISYGENIPIQEKNIIRGIDIYFNSINTNDNIAAVIINLNTKKNELITGTEGKSTPSWLAKSSLKAFTDNKITKDLHRYYLSHLSKTSFKVDYTLSKFLENNIPAITINISEETNSNNFTKDILKSLISDLNTKNTSYYDSHFLLLRLFRQTILLSEYTIVQIILVIFFVSLIFIFTVSFINKNLQNTAWQELKKNWYTLPLTFILIVLSFYGAKFAYKLWTPFLETKSPYGLVILQFSVSLFVVSIFFILELFFHKSYGEHSIDFLILISTFLNLSFFAFYDVSLFPFFYLLFFIAILSVIFKNNILHFFLLLLMIFTFIPYIYRLNVVSDSNALKNFIYNSNFVPVGICLILMPIYIMWLRILTAIKTRYVHNKRLLSVIITLFYVLIVSGMYVTNHFVFEVKPIDNNSKNIIVATDNDDIEITYSDEYFFDDIIRSITIKTKLQPILTKVNVSSTKSNPIQYSSSDFSAIDEFNSQFLIPTYPSKELTYDYGATHADSTITVTEYFEQGDNIIQETKTLFIGGNE